MNGSPFPRLRLGIVGGGQLGLMLIQAAADFAIETVVLDPDPLPPAGRYAGTHIRAPLSDREGLHKLAQSSDIITYEIETIDPAVLSSLETPVHPEPGTLSIIRDKLNQRRHLESRGVPGPEFLPLSGLDGGAVGGALREFGYPLVVKHRYGGYDGRGVLVCDSEREWRDAGWVADRPGRTEGIDNLYLERKIGVETEVAVLVARSVSGELAVYDPVEMYFDPMLNLVDRVTVPARITGDVRCECRRVAEAAVRALPGAGLFAVELFVTARGVLVNEIAPRPHNSGHITVEAAVTSQYHQHLRAILDLPLGNTAFTVPAVMHNLVGRGTPGPARYLGISEALSEPNVSVHLYGKRESREGRKMGHLCAVGEGAAQAAARAAAGITITGEAG